MLVQIRDEAALSSLSIINLRTYLVSHGWTDQGQWGTRPATVFGVESRERTWEIIVPTRDTVIGYAEGMAHSIAVLAAVEERSEFDVFHDIKAAGADVIRVRSATGSGEEPMSLRQSANLLKDAYDMLAASARAAERPQAAYRGKMSSDVAEYLDKVWPWTGYDQGHSLTLHSPVPAGFGKQQDLGDEFIAPFPRQATSKLAQALGRTRTAIEDVVARDTLDSFKQAVNFGVSANLCDSIADLAKNGQGVEIDLTWADVRPSRVEDSRFQFSSLSADILTEAAKSFRQTEPSL